MSYWTAVILGIIEGITEFLPISSTGHLLLAEHALKMATQPSEMFNVVIQCGAVLAVLMAFSQRLQQLWSDRRKPDVQGYLARMAAAFAVTVAGVLILKKLGLAHLPETARPVAWATLIGGVLILGMEWMGRDRVGHPEISWTIAVAVGLAQVVAATFPGTSRSGASILMAMALGIARPQATEFSFLLGVPTLLAAGGYSILSALKKAEPVPESIGHLAVGTAIAAITAFIAVRWLLRYVQTHTFVPFGWYRIVLGGLILAAAS